MSGFAALALEPSLVARLASIGYRQPTPIQREAIPHALADRDVLASAQTGTGKTAAFALPILDRLLRHAPRGAGRRPIRALVLAPTRELAAQIDESLRSYVPGRRIRSDVVFGGVGKRPQVASLRRGVDVLVATPGRLLDLMADREVDLSKVETFVIGEADRVLDMGFIPDVRRITAALPHRRQTLMFSATQPREIRELAPRLLHQPVEIAVDPVSSTVEPIAQSVFFVDGASKLGLLVDLLGDAEIERVLVFARTKRRADRLAKSLGKQGIGADAIHGAKSQNQRVRSLDRFKRGRTRVLVATDVASRGIHVEDIDTVINFDLPDDAETYVHRIGRTGRAGADGTALTLCAADERSQLASIERLTRQRIDRRATPAKFGTGPAVETAPRDERRPRPTRRRPVDERGGERPRRRRRSSRTGRGRRPGRPTA